MNFPTSSAPAPQAFPSAIPQRPLPRARLLRPSLWIVSSCAFLILSLPSLAACAATPGDLFAEGYRHLTGQGVPRDATMASRFFLEAAQSGEPQSQYQLGVMYMEGLGLPMDLLWAYYWLDQSNVHPGLPDMTRDQARGRLDVLRQQLSADQKRRLGFPSRESQTP